MSIVVYLSRFSLHRARSQIMDDKLYEHMKKRPYDGCRQEIMWNITRFGSFAILTCLVMMSCLAANAVNATGFEKKAVFIESKLTIDGILDEEAWGAATRIDEFYQRQPNTGDPVSKATVFLILYNQDNIYFGIKCTDTPDEITAKELARDISLGEDDRIQIILDTFLDGRNGYWFQIGPRGSIGDALISENGAGFNKQWDGLWQGRAKIHESGWDAEIAIPFKTLNFKPDQDKWGMKLIRHIKRNLESSYWPVANLDSYRFQVSDAGRLGGLQGITKGIGLDIRPYGLVGLDTKYNDKNDWVLNLGGEIFYRPTPGIKTALTFNTDFAQTEVDSRQINLTRFSLLFPEKRDFFLDGANYFDFGLGGDGSNNYASRNIPFFSRRIGLDPDGAPVPILWGVKMTGQAGGWNLGFQNIMDRYEDRNRNFTVMRVSRFVGKQSYIGMMGTRGNALSSDANHLVGLDVKLATSQFKGNKNVAFTAFLLKSWTDEIKGNDWAWGGEVNYPNDLISARLGHQEIGENYRPGIGFAPRLGIRETYGDFLLGPRPKKWGILQIKSGAGMDYVTDMANALLTRRLRIRPVNLEFLSGDEAGYDLQKRFEYLNSDFEIFPKDSITVPAGTYDFWRQEIEIEMARRRNFFISAGFEWGDFFDGKRKDITLEMGYKISVPFFIGVQYEQNDVNLQEGKFTTRIYRLNADIYFNPDITLTNFVQFDNVTEKVGIQSRFRYIIKPGNEIIFAWNSSMYELPEHDRMVMSESSTRLKLNYNFRF